MTADRIRATSFSRLKEYRECPLKAKLKFVLKVEDPRPPLPEGQEHPLDRGSRIHELAENVVRYGCDGPFPKELEKFQPRLERLRELYVDGRAYTEMPIAMDENWKQSDPRDFENTVYRMIADMVVVVEPAHYLIIDYKTGRKDGNEVVHTQQGIEYLSAFALTHPDIQRFQFEAWYLDKGEILPTITFSRHELSTHIKSFMESHKEMRDARYFPPTPSMQACLFCPFKKGDVGRGKNSYAGTGHCDRNAN